MINVTANAMYNNARCSNRKCRGNQPNPSPSYRYLYAWKIVITLFPYIYIYFLENGLEIFMYFYTAKYRNHLHFLSLPGPKGLSNTGIKPKSKK